MNFPNGEALERPVRTMLAILKNVPDEIKVLVLLMRLR